MKVLIRKPDLDTCLTALILGVTEADDINVITNNASEQDILNPDVLCIEAGGSGLDALNNFDHHDPNKYFPPACVQAYTRKNLNNEKIEKLTRYVCIVDEKTEKHPVMDFPSLSNIFSGMMLLEKDKLKQFIKGIAILKTVVDNDIDPLSTMPDIEQWQPYKMIK
ncbi:hypothetical protein MCHI_000539, partial [Candidatus Magnetoovum chiemensis]